MRHIATFTIRILVTRVKLVMAGEILIDVIFLIMNQGAKFSLASAYLRIPTKISNAAQSALTCALVCCQQNSY